MEEDNSNYKTLEKPKSTLSIDEITNNSSLTKYPLLNYINSAIFLFIDGIEMHFFIFLLIPFREKFHFSKAYESLCASMIFFGFALGSVSANYLIKIYGRALVLKITSISIVLFHLIMIIFLNKVIFVIMRFFMGISLGIYFLFLNLFSEYRPISSRGFQQNLLWVFYQISCLIQILIVLMIMPNYEVKKLRLTLFIFLIFPIIGSVVHYFTLYDSPRNLIVNGEQEKAFEILKDMNNGLEFTEEEKLKIVNEVNITSSNRNFRNHISDLFTKELFQTTILLILIFFIFSGAYYGINVLTTITQEKLNGKEKQNNHKVIISQLVYTITTIIFLVPSSFIIELKYIGRKGLIMMCFILASFISIPSVYIKGSYGVLIGIYVFATFVGANVLITYCVEIYPTKLRDLSTGFHIMVYRILCGFAQVWILALFHIKFRLPYFIICALCIFGSLLTFILPYETKDRPLDSKYHNTESDKLNISQDNSFKEK